MVENYLLKLPLAYYGLQIHAILIDDFILSFTLALGPFATHDFFIDMPWWLKNKEMRGKFLSKGWETPDTI